MNDQINIQKCKHNIRSKDTSVIILDTPRTFPYPEHVYGVCKCCGKSFHFIKDENGKMKRFNKKK